MATEYEELDESLNKKITELATLIKGAKHAVISTGAGISVSASIPDFRGPKGVWTLKERGEVPTIDVEFEEALPTLAHMSIVELLRRGLLKHVISQNVDGLHLRSGVPREQLSELHGNVYLEICETCKAPYLRDFDAAQDAHDDHFTGRLCEACGGRLLDSIIDFGEDLPEEDLNTAAGHASQADLMIVMGSSLKVTSACDLPRLTLKNNGKLVIVNLQKTPLDPHADMRLFAKIDKVMLGLMKELDIEIPMYTIASKRIMVGNTCESETSSNQDTRTWRLFVCGECGYNCPLIQKIELKVLGTGEAYSCEESDKFAKSKAKKKALPQPRRSFEFSGKQQGDLITGTLNVVRGKRRKVTDDKETNLEVELVIHFKSYCNTAPANVRYTIKLDDGIHETLLKVPFQRTTDEIKMVEDLEVVQQVVLPLC